jgi:uroporphyrin-III C-methyltransferase/precorrin-2 dehydrogenase/sirohydrochlorin ferrochelatase
VSLFPIFVKLQGRTVVVVGAGVIAEGKIPGLFAAGANVRVVAPQATRQIQAWAREDQLEWLPRTFASLDLEGASLVIAATSAPGVNRSVFQACEARGILCNAVDDIENCHFYYGAIVQRGDLQIAISTNGKSPALAQRIRKELEATYGEDYAEWLEKLGTTRTVLRAKSADPERTKIILHGLASKQTLDRYRSVTKKKCDATDPKISLAASPTANRGAQPGTVYLVGAGPGDPELLTRKALRLLQSAQIVLHDSLVSREILAEISPTTQIIDVGKRAGQKLLTQEEINSLLVSYAQDHAIVVRLKGGDPSIFGRAGEELQALRNAGIPHEIVPGVTAALAAAAAAKISLTDRRVASQVLFTTFSRGTDGALMDWGCLTSTTTLALYMPGPDYAEVSGRLREGGLSPDLPCAVISAASGQRQIVRRSTVAELAAEEKLPAPALLIVGRVANHQISEIAETAWRTAGNREPALQTTRIS